MDGEFMRAVEELTEQHFGKNASGCITKIVLVCAILLAVAVGVGSVGVIWNFAVKPVIEFVTKGVLTWDDVIRLLIVTTVYVLMGLSVVVFIRWNGKRTLSRLGEHIQRHVEDGGLHIVVSGEDAEKQWPEIKRRLDERDSDIFDRMEGIEQNTMLMLATLDESEREEIGPPPPRPQLRRVRAIDASDENDE